MSRDSVTDEMETLLFYVINGWNTTGSGYFSFRARTLVRNPFGSYKNRLTIKSVTDEMETLLFYVINGWNTTGGGYFSFRARTLVRNPFGSNKTG